MIRPPRPPSQPTPLPSSTWGPPNPLGGPPAQYLRPTHPIGGLHPPSPTQCQTPPLTHLPHPDDDTATANPPIPPTISSLYQCLIAGKNPIISCEVTSQRRAQTAYRQRRQSEARHAVDTDLHAQTAYRQSRQCEARHAADTDFFPCKDGIQTKAPMRSASCSKCRRPSMHRRHTNKGANARRVMQLKTRLPSMHGKHTDKGVEPRRVMQRQEQACPACTQTQPAIKTSRGGGRGQPGSALPPTYKARILIRETSCLTYKIPICRCFFSPRGHSPFLRTPYLLCGPKGQYINQRPIW